MTEQVTVLYIGGHGRSGSTILAQTLGQIPGFVNVGSSGKYGIGGFGRMSAAVAGNSFTHASSGELSERRRSAGGRTST